MRLRAVVLTVSMFVCGVVPAAGQQPAHANGSAHPIDATVAAQMRQAVSAAQHADGQRALAITGKILELHPDFEPALKLQGMVLEQSGRSNEAASSFEKALTLAPNDPDLLFSVGVSKLVTRDYPQAIVLLEHHRKLRPLHSDALYYLAQAYHLNDRNDLALKTIQACLTLDPNNPSVWQKYGELLSSAGDNEKALVWLEKAHRADATLDRIDYDLGAANYNGMNFSDAFQYAQRAYQLNPKDINARALLASAEVKLARWRDALVDFEGVLSAHPDDTSALMGLGHCQLELRQFAASIATLQHALQIDPALLLAHFYLSRDYGGLGDAEQAKHESDLHQRLMEQASFTRSGEGAENAREKAIRKQARQLLTDQHEAEALKLFEQAARGESATPGGAYVLLGSLYLSMGDAANATRCLNQALKLEPRVRGAHTYLGIEALLQDDLAGAEREFNAELTNDPNYATAIAELGEVRYRQQRWAESAELLTRSKTVIPPLLFLLCDAYFHLGKTSDANLTAETLATYARQDRELMLALIDLLNRNHQTEVARRMQAALEPS